MNKAGERLWNGLLKENPTFVLMLGMCPTLAVTTSAGNALGMGLTTLAVLALSNLIISLLRKVIPNRVRIPAFIVIIASFVTMAQLLLEAYRPELNKSLGVYIPLIVVNCIILGRAESFAYANPPIPSLFDGIGMGLGFTVALTCIGAVRELLGAGELFGYGILPETFEPIRIFGLAPGAFFVLAALVAVQNFVKNRRKKAGKPYEKIGSGCSEDCLNCDKKGCERRFYDLGAEPAKEAGKQEESQRKEKKQEKAGKREKPKPEKSRQEESKSEKPKPENSRQEESKSEKPRLEESKPEESKPEENGRVESDKREENKQEENRQEENRQEKLDKPAGSKSDENGREESNKREEPVQEEVRQEMTGIQETDRQERESGKDQQKEEEK